MTTETDEQKAARETAEAAKAAEDKQAADQGRAKSGKKGKAALGDDDEDAGPICKEEVRYKKRTYAIGEALPSDVPDDVLGRLKQLGHI